MGVELGRWRVFLPPGVSVRGVGSAVGAWCLAVVILFIVGGCAAGAHAQREGDAPAAVALQPPTEMEGLVDALMRYWAAHGRLPVGLERLVEAELLPAEAKSALADHAYARGGLGRLPDGRRVVAVEAQVRAGDRAWCIVDRPEATTGTAHVELVLVPMDALRHAAAQ